MEQEDCIKNCLVPTEPSTTAATTITTDDWGDSDQSDYPFYFDNYEDNYDEIYFTTSEMDDSSGRGRRDIGDDVACPIVKRVKWPIFYFNFFYLFLSA